MSMISLRDFTARIRARTSVRSSITTPGTRSATRLNSLRSGDMGSSYRANGCRHAIRFVRAAASLRMRGNWLTR